MAGTLASMMVRIGADISNFDAGMNKVQGSLKQTGQLFDQFGRVISSIVQPIEETRKGSDRLSREFSKLTSGTDFLIAGIKRFRTALSGILWGTVIGAVAAVAFELLNQAKAWFSATKELEKYKAAQDAIITKRDEQLAGLENEKARLEALQDQYKSIGTLKSPRFFGDPSEVSKIAAALDEVNASIAFLKGTTVDWGKALKQETMGMEITLKALADRHGAIQRQMGNDIVDEARKAYAEKTEIIHAAGLEQERLGMEIVKKELDRQRDAGAVQEQMGRDIVLAAQLSMFKISDEAMKHVNSISSGFGNAVAQMLVYGASFRDTMTRFFQQWAAQTIAYIIQVQTQMLILKAITTGAALGGAGAGAGAGGGSGAVAGGTGTTIMPHSGGTVGVDSIPRFHSGVGPDEMMAVLKKGESVLTPGQMKALGDGAIGGTTVQQKIQFLIPAMDGASVERMLRAQKGVIQKVISDAVRDSRSFAREVGR